MAALFALSLSSLLFTDNKAAILLFGIGAGFLTVFEETGWTGFAVPRLRLRYSVFTTGLIVDVLWAAWHFLQILYVSGVYSGNIPLIIFQPLYFFSSLVGLTAY
jgi:membrane protease YdiL (CAAX protease family)